MGVSGCGKTLIGKKLAKEFAYQFIEGDDYHSLENKKKMESGQALDDTDRECWLASLEECLSESKESVVLSCSALKRKYRKILSGSPHHTIFIHLDVTKNTLKNRLNVRKGHFFNPLLLQDQLNILEGLDPSENGFSVNSDQNPEKIIADILSKLNDKKYEFQNA
jgi:carbohydrate kinase (thermoresistant glucokinase family)